MEDRYVNAHCDATILFKTVVLVMTYAKFLDFDLKCSVHFY